MALLETARFRLPMLATGQAHKELFHNEALARVDFLLHSTVKAIAADPAAIDPLSGDCWMVGPGAQGEWEGHEDELAGWTGNGWLFFAPVPQMRIYIETIGKFAIYRDIWVLSDAIESPTGGATIDSEARLAIESILTVLTTHGIIDPVT